MGVEMEVGNLFYYRFLLMNELKYIFYTSRPYVPYTKFNLDLIGKQYDMLNEIIGIKCDNDYHFNFHCDSDYLKRWQYDNLIKDYNVKYGCLDCFYRRLTTGQTFYIMFDKKSGDWVK